MDDQQLIQPTMTATTSGLGQIVLRDIPKQQAQIDLVRLPIQGGFRGFQLVPAGPHYVSVVDQDSQSGFWCYLHPNEVIVKVFDETHHIFVDDTPEGEAHYTDLASSGAMGKVLAPYNLEAFELWTQLTHHITADMFPLALHPIPDQVPNRFAHAFNTVHGGVAASLLAEFQFAFVSWYVNSSDQASLQRWVYLVQAIYNAGERMMVGHPELFGHLVDSLLVQFDLLQDSEFAPDSSIGFGADYLSEDLMDTDVDLLVEKGRAFRAYLAKRGLS